MDRKARENLAAGRLLLRSADPATNAAAARAYYAAYQAVWCAMVDDGHAIPENDGRRYFRHLQLPSEAVSAGVLDVEEAENLELLLMSRVLADYYDEDVELDAARTSLAMAEEVVLSLLGAEEDWSG